MQVGNLELEGCAVRANVLASFIVDKTQLQSRTDLVLYWLVASSWRQILSHGGYIPSSIDLDFPPRVVQVDVDSEAVGSFALTVLGQQLLFCPLSRRARERFPHLRFPNSSKIEICGTLSRPQITMAKSEERPSKIRRLDSNSESDRIAEYAPFVAVGSSKTSTDEAATWTGNDGAESIPFASKDDEPCSLSLDGGDDVVDTKPSQPISKNQLKKLLKKQNWEEGREYRKAKRREKDKQKKIRKAETRAALDARSTEDGLPAPEPPKRNSQRPVQLPITFILDCDFDDLMTEAELISLGAQLTRCYSDNKSAPYRAHLVVSSFGGKLKHRFETVLSSNHLGWKGVNFTADDFIAAATEADGIMRGVQGGKLVGAFAGISDAVALPHQPPSQFRGEFESEIPAERKMSVAKESTTNGIATISTEEAGAKKGASVINKSSDMVHGAPPEEPNAKSNDQALKPWHDPSIVYLTSDSPHTLDVLSPYTTYIIGGIVDKNRHKGICYERAMARGIPTAKLPIGEYMTMQSRSVLATNHVAEIMLRWLENGDWAKAFLQVIPKRKEAKLKVKRRETGDLGIKEDGHASSDSQGD